MAYIEPRKNKHGEIIAYRIRVNKGYDKNGKKLKPYELTFKPDPDKTERQNMKALKETAVEFEKKCKQGYIADSRQTFAEYAEYVIALKERTGIKRRTIEGYKKLMPRINEAIGHMKLKDIRPQHLNMFYEQLSKRNSRRYENVATAKADLKALIKEKKLSQQKIADSKGMAVNTVAQACKGRNIKESKARAIADALGLPITKLFVISHDSSPLSNKTILEYHRLINTIFKQADKELLIPYNPASKATPPKAGKAKINYFEIEELEAIQREAETLPIKWKTIIHLLMVSGCRRGELCGLKWDAVDFERGRIYIHLNLLYSPEIGLYEDTTKTEYSERYVKLPDESMDILREYKAWYEKRKAAYGDRWHDKGFLFFQEKTGNEGEPMSPDTVTRYLDEFSEKRGLPHINPHAFRHTMASVMCFNRIDPVSISRRLGHSKVSTTTDYYSHMLKDADDISAETIADVMLRHKPDEGGRKAG